MKPKGYFKPSEARATQSISSDVFWHIRQCVLVMWRTPYSFGSWLQTPELKKKNHALPNEDIICGRLHLLSVLPTVNPVLFGGTWELLSTLNVLALDTLVTSPKYPALLVSSSSFIMDFSSRSSWWLQWFSWSELSGSSMEIGFWWGCSILVKSFSTHWSIFSSNID